MRYPCADGAGHVTVATTRPETYLGDTAVAVNPKDPRFTGLVGRRVKLPVTGREIPIVADEAISMEFGAGSLKVTPGHDPVDFEIGARHGLEIINVMNLDATINERGGPFAGMDRFKAREAIVREFERLGLLEKVEPHTHAVGHCQRCKTIVEPLVSKQWFVKVGSHEEPDSIAGRACRAVVDGRIAIVPERFAKVYLNWMENIRDWCISRQLWWGHRIPVWYCQESACGHLTIALEDPAACERCGSKRIVQDSDVLDTWFSSALWTHSTLGWPGDTEDLRYFYPTSVMETGYDILFFWVARMIMMGLENTGQAPFQTVFLHGLIRDETGQKMSKTKGNVVDPLETASQYGTDALRFALTTGTSPGNDARLTPAKLENARNFANKVWNASRFVLTAVDQGGTSPLTPHGDSGQALSLSKGERDSAPLEDRWILSRLHRAIDEVSRMLEAFQIGEAQRAIYDFLWSDYCDWYIELAKIRLRDPSSASGGSPLPVLVHVLEQTMRLLHPFMPFVTEEVWQAIVQRRPGDATRPASVMVAPYPAADPAMYDDDAERRMGLTIEIITAIRNARAELKVDPAKRVEAIVDAAEHRELVLAQRAAIETLARANPLRVYGSGQPAPAFEKARVAVLRQVRVIVPTAGLVDVDAERRKAADEAGQLERSIGQIEARLASPEFTGKAPPAVVEKERARLAGYREKLARLRERLKELE